MWRDQAVAHVLQYCCDPTAQWVAVATTPWVDVDDAFAGLQGEHGVLRVVVFAAIGMAMDQPAQFGLEQGIASPGGTSGGQLAALAEADHGHGVVQWLDLQAGARTPA
ncbi:hypothetical protein D9M71_743320 [compost metagenome]